MNERIRELETQAHELAWQEWKHLPESNDGTRMDAQALARFKNKFAELIVKKCGEIAAFGDSRYSTQHNIHEYFGVE